MNIEGTYTLQAPMEEVWRCLVDLQALQRTMPGLEHLEHTGNLTYAFTLRVKQAPLRGVYQGKVTFFGVPYPDPYPVHGFSVEGDEQPIPFQGIWDILLSQQQGNTIVTYRGALDPGKMSVLLPPTLVKGAVKILLQQFFANMAEQLRATPESLSAISNNHALEAQEGYGYIEERDRWIEEYSRENGNRTTLAFEEPVENGADATGRTLLHRLVRLTGLGQHDPFQEERWVERFKRFGAFSILLLLVWIGTRLPRRLLPRE